MGKTFLTIDPEYCPSWGWFEGIREFIQNAKDADEFEGHEMKIEHQRRSNKLVISNKNVVVPTDRLAIVGTTSKRGTDQRGQFGEGFVLGTLALIRAGHPVTIFNGDEVWRPSIEEAERGPFKGKRLLHLNPHKLQNTRDTFSIEIENVSGEIWLESKKLFLFLCPPRTEETVKTPHGTALLGDEYRGRVFGCRSRLSNRMLAIVTSSLSRRTTSSSRSTNRRWRAISSSPRSG
jgi:hypothetical protein